MIAKNKKGKSFGGCVRYVMNESCEILAAEGVLAEDAATIIRDFTIQRSGRPEIKQPVGHIAVSFSPEDSAKMTNKFMLQLAHEYMDKMKIGHNTQYVIVRHHNTDHEHFHIVYNRIDNDLKLISVNNDYKRNIRVCKKLKDKYELTYGKKKEKVNRQKLKGADKVKYEIHDQIAAILPKCNSYIDLEKQLAQGGITIQYKYQSGAKEMEENIQGVSFKKGNYSFKGSEIDRKFSHGKIKKVLDANMTEFLKFIFEPDAPMPQSIVSEPGNNKDLSWKIAMGLDDSVKEPESSRLSKRYPRINGVELTSDQDQTLKDGGHIFLENMERKEGKGKFSAYVFLNDEKKRAFSCNENPDKMVEYGGITIRLRDKIQVEKGHIVKAKMKWWGGIDYQYPFVWKKSDGSNKVEYSFFDPRIPKEVHQKEVEEFRKKIQQNIPKQKNKGLKLR